VRRAESSAKGGAGIDGVVGRGRSGRTTGGGKRSAVCGRSIALASTAGLVLAGGAGGTCTTEGGVAGVGSAVRACSTERSVTVSPSPSSSRRKGECFVSTAFTLIGGGSIDAVLVVFRADSVSVSPVERGGVIGDTLRRSGGGNGGATGRSGLFDERGGGSVGGTDFRVSEDAADCCPGIGAADAGEVTRPCGETGPRVSILPEDGRFLEGATGIAGGACRGATGIAGGVCIGWPPAGATAA
jgi:hypothetical protein